jgi:ubiquinone/menaquinone biosynthesis C-methylase UbiE
MTASSTFAASSGEGYELQMGRWSRRLAVPFLTFAGAAPGEHVLEVGCGTGSLTRHLVERSEAGAISAIDYAAPYVAHAKATIDDPRVDIRVGDATALPFADGTFDRVLTLLVLHFVADPHRAVAEMRRVAKPGATIAGAVWDARGGFVASRMFVDTAAAIEPSAAAMRARAFARPMTRPGELEAAWRKAGLVEIEATELTIRMEFASFEDYWTPYVGKDGPLAQYVSGLDDPTRETIRAAVRAAYLDSDPDGPRSYAATAWAVKGTAP